MYKCSCNIIFYKNIMISILPKTYPIHSISPEPHFSSTAYSFSYMNVGILISPRQFNPIKPAHIAAQIFCGHSVEGTHPPFQFTVDGVDVLNMVYSFLVLFAGNTFVVQRKVPCEFIQRAVKPLASAMESDKYDVILIYYSIFFR